MWSEPTAGEFATDLLTLGLYIIAFIVLVLLLVGVILYATVSATANFFSSESSNSQEQSQSYSTSNQPQASSVDKQELLSDAEQFFDSAETFFRVLAAATDNDTSVERTELRQTQTKPSREFQQDLKQVTTNVDKRTIDPYEPTEDTEIEDLLKDLEKEEELWK